MIIECPQCSQRIDLGESNLTAFACPSCNTQITLQIAAVAGSGSPVQSEIADQEPRLTTQTATSASRGKKGFNLFGWLFAIIIFPLTLGKCVDKIMNKATGSDPDQLKRYFEPRSLEADRETLEHIRRINKPPQERP